MQVCIITPTGVIYEGEIRALTLPGSEGEFGVLAGHKALIASLKSGLIDLEKMDAKHELVAIEGGHVKIQNDQVEVLAKGAVWVGGEGEIAKNIENAKELIRSMSSDNAALAATMAKLDNAGING